MAPPLPALPVGRRRRRRSRRLCGPFVTTAVIHTPWTQASGVAKGQTDRQTDGREQRVCFRTRDELIFFFSPPWKWKERADASVA